MNKSFLRPDLSEAQRFLDALDPLGQFTFQTFPDRKEVSGHGLTRIVHGNLSGHEKLLKELNRSGGGIFVTVNRTDLMGRKAENVIRTRAVFVDLDGAPLEPILNFGLEPQIVVESSLGRWHAYWLCDVALTDFGAVQSEIIDKFAGDKAIKDLPRVMRLPGFFHQKSQDHEPFLTRIESIMEGAQLAPYTSQEILAAFPIPDVKKAPKRAPPEERDTILHVMPTDGRLVDLLGRLDPEDREEWIAVAHALKSDGEVNLGLFCAWSRGELTGCTPNNYVSDEDVIKTWNSSNPTRTDISALFSRARSKGLGGKTPMSENQELRSNSHVACAQYLVAQHSTPENPLIFDEGDFWLYNAKLWAKVPKNILRVWVHKLDGKDYGDGKKCIQASKSFIDGVISEMAASITMDTFFDDAPVGANLNNGFVRLETDGTLQIEKHSPEHKQRACINCEWQPGPPAELHGYTNILFDGCFGQEDIAMRRLILEIIGTALLGTSTKIHSPKGFILFGPTASNGKSRILNIMRQLLPDYATCSIPPADLDKEQSLATLVGCVANLSDELSSSKSIASDKMKAVITGDVVSAKVIYREVFNFAPRAMHVYATNALPTFKGGVDAGVERRMLVVPFDRTIPKENRIPAIDEKIVNEEANPLVSASLIAGAQVFKSGQFSTPQNCLEATELWFKEADPVREWYDEGGLSKHAAKQPVLLKDLYKKFVGDMEDTCDSNYIPQKRRFFGQIRALIAGDPEWQISRRSDGETVFAARLV
ncbi:phage/plasmid primase, P4 family [Paracoccaceae bacterium]|nr:phage/plasmid primase, P4 family [Paracoccaceae bacterium]